MDQRWYKSNIMKAVHILLAHIMIVIVTVSFLWLIAYPALRTEIFDGNPAEEYKDTVDFGERMLLYSARTLEEICSRNLFEADGKYDPDRLVDIEEYYNTGGFSGENKGKLIYRLGDLIEWGKNFPDDSDDTENILVCKTEDGHYQYYLLSEFSALINSGELHFAAANGGAEYTDQQILLDLQYSAEEWHGPSSGIYHGIQDKEGRLIYSDCWLYDGQKYEETYKPEGADSLIAIANEDSEWNGKLSEAYDILRVALHELQSRYESYEVYGIDIEEGNTNFSYIYADIKNKHIYTNRKKYESYAGMEKSLDAIRGTGQYIIVEPKLADFETNMDIVTYEWWNQIRYGGISEEDFIFAAAVDTKYPVQDEFYSENELYKEYGSYARYLIFWGLTAAVIFLINVLWLIVTAGRSSRDDELHLNWFDHWKTELAAAVVILAWFIPTFILFVLGGGRSVEYVLTEVGRQVITRRTYISNSFPYYILYSIVAVYTCGMFLVGFLSLVRRLKARTVWKNSILRSICVFIVTVFRNMKSVWKIVIVTGGFAFIQFLFFLDVRMSGYRSSFFGLLMLAADVPIFIYLIYREIGKYRIQTGIERIAGGEVDYTICTDYLRGEQREMAEKINSIGEGLEAALEESMKSERLKTDLITNVSHDIKTPLTSIINYVELLKQENFEDPKLRRYIEVLEQKSQRLKTLTEDVVEASKISSGNITLEYMDINFVEMIQQTSGEFEEKFSVRGLKEVLTLPDEDAVIRADGRRTWRVLENVYNNVAKYAMEGTRVYGDLTVDGSKVSFSLKNISEQSLNISADELTERFIRGDISRSTEGSGLGLSIAKTLTEMQGGEFKLYLDGDLFKVTITFPRVR